MELTLTQYILNYIRRRNGTYVDAIGVRLAIDAAPLLADEAPEAVLRHYALGAASSGQANLESILLIHLHRQKITVERLGEMI
jgi:hypothetical protein